MNFNQGQRVFFDVDGKTKGFGRVCGFTSKSNSPEDGYLIIVEMEDPQGSGMDSTSYPYPYSHTAIHESKVECR